jgi:hypothetical protein
MEDLIIDDFSAPLLKLVSIIEDVKRGEDNVEVQA